jgi:ABC-type spermidine/putrescine transport system permease subunit I
MQPSPMTATLRAATLRRRYKHFLSMNNDSYWWGYLFLLPNFLGFLIFTAGPFLAGLILSFYRWDMLSPPQFAGLENYVTLLTNDPLFWKGLVNTLWYSVLSIPLGIVCSLALAIALNRSIARSSRLPYPILYPCGLLGHCRISSVEVVLQYRIRHSQLFARIGRHSSARLVERSEDRHGVGGHYERLERDGL